ncbi:MAG: transcription antitermination factor NusB [Sphingopyxis sp.]|nr:transcription antitermination factor NusB [Sphingopyxis sp.]
MSPKPTDPAARALARSAARLAAVQALYQHDMEGTPLAQLLHEFHQHRLGATVDDEEFGDASYAEADVAFFDDLVRGTIARLADTDAAIAARLSAGWTLARLERAMKAVLRVGTYELIARPDVPAAAAINEYVEVAKAFHSAKDAGFVNGLLDAVAKGRAGG